MKTSTTSTSERTHLIALLAAFCLFLSMIEYLIPKPLPFMRIGLANLPVLLSLIVCRPKETLLLVGLKVLGQGIVNGTLFSYIFLFSAVGSVSSGVLMLSAHAILKHRVSMVGLCVVGALASNLSQILLARLFVFGRSAYLMGPPFLLLGTVSAIILGYFATSFVERSQWLKQQQLSST